MTRATDSPSARCVGAFSLVELYFHQIIIWNAPVGNIPKSRSHTVLFTWNEVEVISEKSNMSSLFFNKYQTEAPQNLKVRREGYYHKALSSSFQHKSTWRFFLLFHSLLPLSYNSWVRLSLVLLLSSLLNHLRLSLLLLPRTSTTKWSSEPWSTTPRYYSPVSQSLTSWCS